MENFWILKIFIQPDVITLSIISAIVASIFAYFQINKDEKLSRFGNDEEEHW